jgi:4-diphosphocytidyl-2-C-methyl-D-erythritol kinase
MRSDVETEFAPAKINLTLHVTGQRADGYHLLDSLVAFVDVGDVVSAVPHDQLTLTLTGATTANLSANDDNLVLRAARSFGTDTGAALTLEKCLPIASGIGGGSTDAAATLRLLSRMWGLPLPDPAKVLALGADVPACLTPHAVRMTGVGEGLIQQDLPQAWLVLVNPGVSVATPDVFRALGNKHNQAMPAVLPSFADADVLAGFLHLMRNDLEVPATALAPIIASAKAALTTQPGCLIARMSGSGATCFGLFSDPALANNAAKTVSAIHPAWWVAQGKMLV